MWTVRKCRWLTAQQITPTALASQITKWTHTASTLANVGYIDWPNVKSVTIKKARPLYFSGDADWLYPFLYLRALVDTGNGTVEVGIDCPIIDESKL